MSTLSRCSAVPVLVKKEQQDSTIPNSAPGVLPCFPLVLWNRAVVSWGEVLFLRDNIPATHLYPQSPMPAPGLHWNSHSQAKPASGTFACLSEMAFPVHHPADWGSVQCSAAGAWGDTLWPLCSFGSGNIQKV